jgi:hypothetical protein
VRRPRQAVARYSLEHNYAFHLTVFFATRKTLRFFQESLILGFITYAAKKKGKMKDQRIVKLAQLVMKYSLNIKPGETLSLQGNAIAAPLIRELYHAAIKTPASMLIRRSALAGSRRFFSKRLINNNSGGCLLLIITVSVIWMPWCQF